MDTKEAPQRSTKDRLADILLTAEPTYQFNRLKRIIAGHSFEDHLRHKVRGKRILVTGASSGVGRGAALGLLEAGAHVLLVARRSDLLEEVAAEAADYEGKAFIYTCDLSVDEDREKLIKQIINEHGGVDVIINNAGRSIRRSIYESADRLHDYERVMSINYFGAINLTIPLVDQMRIAGTGGHVINISTMGTQLTGTPRFSAYIGSKSALDGFAESVAAETYNDGINWTTVHLPLTQTAMIAPAQNAWSGYPKLSLEAGVHMLLYAVAYEPVRVWHPGILTLGIIDRLFTTKMLRLKASEFPKYKPEKPLPRVAIIGAGMSGIAMAKTLKTAGSDNFVVYEKADSVGGTWRDNTYPGLTCDVPAHFYCYEDDLSPKWSRVFAPGSELREYFENVTEKRGLTEHIKFNSEIDEATFEEGRWKIKTKSGDTDEADVLICATGVLHHPNIPDIKGIDTFEGASFHSARWDHDVPLDGKRVGVIGNGSTGVQIVTALSQQCQQVTLFQRTPQWVFSAPNPVIPKSLRKLAEKVPALQRLAYNASGKLFTSLFRAPLSPGWQRSIFSIGAKLSLSKVNNDKLRSNLTPDFAPMCKRMITSPKFYSAVQQDNVDICTAHIDRIEPTGVVTTDGQLHEFDILVFATGFHAQSYMRPMQVTGRDGLPLDTAWNEGPIAHNTTMIPGFPNLFTLMGPNSPIGNSSLVPIAEAQAEYVIKWMDRMRREGLSEIEPTQEATNAFYEEVNEALGTTVWTSGCNSWYLNDDGRPILWPWPLDELTRRLTTIVESDFHIKRINNNMADTDAVQSPKSKAIQEQESQAEFDSQLLKTDGGSTNPSTAKSKKPSKSGKKVATKTDSKMSAEVDDKPATPKSKVTVKS
ncbi:cation diffusion facilitator CzcD-associated flavoprotein CzcO/NAD(P)-dependent dehydrogenase (short-subunit alcohol dehydrogenase family) [Psychrobacter sp. PL15]|uniref:SDR family NAD(P)-dependent oxidoreductase n=1 Tax=Psychrobacter sp. PL15 TaxID=3071719 RepID=UPI002DFD7C90|nr:cation diffusion facilitator CzcD-associated flavoprotein CzcO/NAD(P)-dependent dehydrogenase (short-subunit alcohol dehydrogenase family) [Psychrobacter sp. PL15]